MTNITNTPAQVEAVEFRGWTFDIVLNSNEDGYRITATAPDGQWVNDAFSIGIDLEDGSLDFQAGRNHHEWNRLAGDRAHMTDGDLGWELDEALCNAILEANGFLG
jgi:hypothetical protein